MRPIRTQESGEFVNNVEEEIRKLYGNDIGVTSPEAILKTIRNLLVGSPFSYWA